MTQKFITAPAAALIAAHGDYVPGTLTDIWGLPASPFTTSGEYE